MILPTIPGASSSITTLFTRSWWQKYFVTLSFLIALLAHLVSIGLLFFLVRSREEVVILRYNAYLGIDLLGVWWQLFLVPAITFFFVLVNTLLMWVLKRRAYPEAAWILAFGTVVLSGAVVVVAFALSFINV